ncbi:hypothetical protein KKF84_06470 [Myxococcota bacterium]|nr:hypothetical protein [Myxococcota bacterium]MBU1534944.1 hypothetical protein [Myxococcota bacterium]
MFSKLKELKDQVLESSLTIGGHVADKLITKTNELIETWGPVLWEQVGRFTKADDSTSAPESMPVEEAPVTPAVESVAVEAPSVAVAKPAKSKAPAKDTKISADLPGSLENISVAALRKHFNRNQVLKVLYIMLRSRQEWLSPAEISEFSNTFKFKVLPGNVRKALNAKGIELGYVLPRMRSNGRKNAKEYKVTAAGKSFVAKELGIE